MKTVISTLVLGVCLATSGQAFAQSNDAKNAQLAMDLLEACPKMPRTTAEGEACFEAEKGMDRILAQSMSDETRGIIQAARVFAVSRVATHYILTDRARLGCEHANRWKQDHDANIAFLRRTGEGEFADSMVQTNANFGEIQQNCSEEQGIKGVAAPLTPKTDKVNLNVSPVATQSADYAHNWPVFKKCLSSDIAACRRLDTMADELIENSDSRKHFMGYFARTTSYSIKVMEPLSRADMSEACKMYKKMDVASKESLKLYTPGDESLDGKKVKALLDLNDSMSSSQVYKCEQNGYLP